MASDNIVPVLHALLQNDNTISAACDYVTPGLPGLTLQDAKLDGPLQTSIWVRRISKTEEPLIGNENFIYDQIIQVDVLSAVSEAMACDLADDIETLLKTTFSKNNVPLNILLQSRTSLFNDTVGAWHEMIRFRATGAY